MKNFGISSPPRKGSDELNRVRKTRSNERIQACSGAKRWIVNSILPY
ncbi:hypothetical protein VCR14J2_610434 [Vibrio coralliirubri]|nr:hypothetical protein VCR12J2_1380352 [Vibrio coralliirubri]CDU08331.1 hypothetical protein VCR14J2_610434 [Vibrio coralliirubri]